MNFFKISFNHKDQTISLDKAGGIKNKSTTLNNGSYNELYELRLSNLC